LRTFIPILFVLTLAAPGVSAAAADSNVGGVLSKAIEAERTADYVQARKLYEAATKQFPDSAEAWAAYGEHLRFFVHDDDAARDAFKKAIDAKDSSQHGAAYAWRGLGEIASKTDEAEAIRNFEQSLKAMPLADTHRSLAHLYSVRRDFKSALKHSEKAAKLDPDDPISRLLYAAALSRKGDKDKAREEYIKALALAGFEEGKPAPEHVHCCVYYNAAGYLAVAGDKPGALTMLKNFFDTPNHRHLSRAQIEGDADFEPLLKSEDFRKLLDQYFKN
jgi:tetratricopeptide (TPR) repeat protein